MEEPGRSSLNRAIIGELVELGREGTATSLIVARDPLPSTFVEFVEENGILLLDPAPRLNRLTREGIAPRYWAGSRRTGHWNPYAHRVIADYLTDEIAPLIQ